MPCPSTGLKMFWTGPNFLSKSKKLIAISASSKTFVTKFTEWKTSFGVAQNVFEFLSGPKNLDQPNK